MSDAHLHAGNPVQTDGADIEELLAAGLADNVAGVLTAYRPAQSTRPWAWALRVMPAFEPVRVRETVRGADPVLQLRVAALLLTLRHANAIARSICVDVMRELLKTRADEALAQLDPLLDSLPLQLWLVAGLILLEAEGLVQMEAHKGAVVAGFSPEEVEELFEFRALLEPALLEKSAPHLTEADYEKLSAILTEYSDELRTQNPGRWGALNTELHTVLYRRARSPRMLATVDQLLKSTDRFARMQLAYTDGRERAEREHREIVSECRAGNVKKAARLLRQHILAAGDALVSLLRERQQTSELAKA